MSSRARLLDEVDAAGADPWFRSSHGPPPADVDSDRRAGPEQAPGSAPVPAVEEVQPPASRYTAQDVLGLALQLEAAIADVARARAEMLQRARPQLVGLALDIARLILRREVERSPAVVGELARIAIDRLAAATDLRVLVHPLDFEVLESVTEQSRRPVGLVPDASVERGGCRIESSYGEIDAGLEAQLAEISRVLLEPDEVQEACP